MSPDLPIQVSKLVFDARQSSWKYAGTDRELEFVIAGDFSRPFPRALAVAESVLLDVAPFVSRAIDYPKQKLTGAESLHDNSWYLEWAEFGVGERLEFPEFELFFSERDTYVLWSVRFRNRAGEFLPVAVTKADW